MEFRNFFLSALPADELQAVLPFLSETSLERGQVLFDVGDPVEHVYFPSSAVISVVTRMSNGDSVESSTVGYETASPLLTALTGQPAKAKVFAQIGGGAVRLPASVLRTRVRASASFSALVLRHVAASSFQTERGVACNALHAAPKRMARWILMTQDRTATRSMPLTQEYLAIMTGVQRTTISVVATMLRQAGYIRYTRGALEVVDRGGLEAYACECYGAVRREFDELLSHPSV